MTETGWQAIGRFARLRRERLGLKQEELALYGGPAVSTVGKFERAAQERFPLRTQHQMEKALGWQRTIVEQVVASIDDDHLSPDEWEHDLVEENLPDMSLGSGEHPRGVDIRSDTDRRSEGIAAVLRLVPEQDQDAAAKDAIVAIFRYVDPGTPAAQRHLSVPSSRTDFALAADPGDDAAGESESYNET